MLPQNYAFVEVTQREGAAGPWYEAILRDLQPEKARQGLRRSFDLCFLSIFIVFCWFSGGFWMLLDCFSSF